MGTHEQNSFNSANESENSEISEEDNSISRDDEEQSQNKSSSNIEINGKGDQQNPHSHIRNPISIKMVAHKLQQSKPEIQNLQQIPKCKSQHIEGFRRASLMRNFCYTVQNQHSWQNKPMYTDSLIAWRKFQNQSVVEVEKKKNALNNKQGSRQTFFINMESKKQKITLMNLHRAAEEDQEDFPHIFQVRTAMRRKSCTCIHCGNLSEKQKQTQDLRYIPAEHRRFNEIRSKVSCILDTPIRSIKRNSTLNNGDKVGLNLQLNTFSQVQSAFLIPSQESPSKKAFIGTEIEKSINTIKEYHDQSFSSNNSQSAKKYIPLSSIHISKSKQKQEFLKEVKDQQQNKDYQEDSFSQANDFLSKRQYRNSESVSKRRLLPKIEGILEKSVKEKSKCAGDLINFIQKISGKQRQQEQNIRFNQIKVPNVKAYSQVNSIILLEENQSERKSQRKQISMGMESLTEFRDRYLNEFAGREAAKNILIRGNNYDLLKKGKMEQQIPKRNGSCTKLREDFYFDQNQKGNENVNLNSQFSRQPNSASSLNLNSQTYKKRKNNVNLKDELSERKEIIEKMLVFSQNHSKVLESPYKKIVTEEELEYEKTLSKKKSKYQRMSLASLPKTNNTSYIEQQQHDQSKNQCQNKNMENQEQQQGNSSQAKAAPLNHGSNRSISTHFFAHSAADPLCQKKPPTISRVNHKIILTQEDKQKIPLQNFNKFKSYFTPTSSYTTIKPFNQLQVVISHERSKKDQALLSQITQTNQKKIV